MQTHNSVQINKVIGQYTLDCRCGQGAYGDVFRATDNILGRNVALKRIFKSKSSIDWQREFEGLRSYCQKELSNNYLLHIYHVDENEDFFYYTMELADNCSNDPQKFIPDTLARRLQSGNIALTQACQIAKCLLRGLQTLHCNELIHRDIKPENIIFVSNTPKLSDIGLVSAVDSTRSISGTMGYIPPEVIFEACSTGLYKFSQQSDLYAAGKVLYCMATGNSPEKYPSVPLALSKEPQMKLINQIVAKACTRSLRKRFQDASDFLDAFNSDPSPGALNIKQINTKQVLVVLAIILFVIMFGWFIKSYTTPKAPEGASIEQKDVSFKDKPAISYPQSGSFSTENKPIDDF